MFLRYTVYFGRPSVIHFLIFFAISNASLSVLGGGVLNNSAKSSMSSVLIPSKGSDEDSLVSGTGSGTGSGSGSCSGYCSGNLSGCF